MCTWHVHLILNIGGDRVFATMMVVACLLLLPALLEVCLAIFERLTAARHSSIIIIIAFCWCCIVHRIAESGATVIVDAFRAIAMFAINIHIFAYTND